MGYKVDYKQMMGVYADFRNAELAMGNFTRHLETVKSQIDILPQLKKDFGPRIESRVRASTAITNSIKACASCLLAANNEYQEADKKVGFIKGIIDWFKNLFSGRKKRDDDGKSRPPIIIPLIIPEPEPKKEEKPKPKPAPPKPAPKPAQNPAPSQPRPSAYPNNLYIEQWELEADLRMWNEAHTIRSNYLPGWRAAGTEAEKMNILNAMLADLQRVMGTSANPEIRFVSQGSAGLYIAAEGVIQLNTKFFGSSDVLKYLIHETRHAYQAEAAGIGIHRGKVINHPVSDARKSIWRSTWQAGDFSVICTDAEWFAGQR